MRAERMWEEQRAAYSRSGPGISSPHESPAEHVGHMHLHRATPDGEQLCVCNKCDAGAR